MQRFVIRNVLKTSFKYSKYMNRYFSSIPNNLHLDDDNIFNDYNQYESIPIRKAIPEYNRLLPNLNIPLQILDPNSNDIINNDDMINANLLKGLPSDLNIDNNNNNNNNNDNNNENDENKNDKNEMLYDIPDDINLYLNGNIILDDDIFAQPIRVDIMHEVVRWQRAGWRRGTAKVKTYNEKSGSNKKPHPQKGLGRARFGNKRAPQRRGGVKTHGPRQRDFSFKINKKIRRYAMRSALSARLLENELTVMENFNILYPKTKYLSLLLDRFNWDTALFIYGDDESPDNFKKASSNIKAVYSLSAQNANVYDILKRQHVILTLSAINNLKHRLLLH